MSQNDPVRTVECTIDEDEELPERSERIKSNLVPRYEGYAESEDGISVRFEGTDETLTAVAQFTANELICCSFAEYELGVSPPYEETVLTVSGPEGTREMFREGFVGRLEEWSA
ncbi:Zn-dependent oxidoreductase [Halobacteriales archaeon QS_8_69_26]|nr:MAG: Zn-dependent oxidoreductase [Halobacteriales archaeon QS_8_69_26]